MVKACFLRREKHAFMCRKCGFRAYSGLKLLHKSMGVAYNAL